MHYVDKTLIQKEVQTAADLAKKTDSPRRGQHTA